MGRHYERLVGKRVVYIKNDMDRTHKLAIVTGCDYSLGITIQEESTKAYILCANGRKSPVMYKEKFNAKQHKFVMQYCYDRIMNKKPILAQELIDLVTISGESFGCSPSADKCAFSQ